MAGIKAARGNMGAAGATDPDLAATAFHEAGHAVMAFRLGMTCGPATIRPDKAAGSLGSVAGGKMPAWADDQSREHVPKVQRWFENSVRCYLAGHITEKRYLGKEPEFGSEGDFHECVGFALHFCGSTREAEAWLHWLHIATEEVCEHPMWWKATEAVAAALLEHETLSARRVREPIQESFAAQMEVARTARAAEAPNGK